MSTGEGTRVSLQGPYREHIHKLLEKDLETIIDFFVSQHMAFTELTNAVDKQQEMIRELGLKIKEDSHNLDSGPQLYTRI